MKTRAALALTLSILSGQAMAAPADADKPVATLVVVRTPPGFSREIIEAGFVKAVPVYENIPGLQRKYFTVNDAGFGGMYLWKSRSAAEAWYSSAWRARAKSTYGVEPELTYFDSPLQIDNTVSKSK